MTQTTYHCLAQPVNLPPGEAGQLQEPENSVWSGENLGFHLKTSVILKMTSLNACFNRSHMLIYSKTRETK